MQDSDDWNDLSREERCSILGREFREGARRAVVSTQDIAVGAETFSIGFYPVEDLDFHRGQKVLSTEEEVRAFLESHECTNRDTVLCVLSY